MLAIAAHMIDPTAMINPALEHPNNQELSQRLVELRVAAGLDIETVARRAGITIEIARELEAGTRIWVLHEIEAFAVGLDLPLVKIFAPWGGSARA